MTDEAARPVPFKDLVAASTQGMLMAVPGMRWITGLNMEAEQYIHHGRVLGLTEDQIAEVVKAYSESPKSCAWIRDALTARAAGEEWRP